MRKQFNKARKTLIDGAAVTFDICQRRRAFLRDTVCHVSVVLGLFVLMTSSVQSQNIEIDTRKGATPEHIRNVEDYLDRAIANAVVAADTAGVIKEADSYRTAAGRKSMSGHRDEALALLRRAGEVIAAAAPEGDIRQQDPLLREYLGDITRELIKLEPANGSSSLTLAGESLAGSVYAANPRVAAFISYFQRRGRSRLEVGRSRLASYRPMMARIFHEEGVPEWLLGVGFVESTYNSAAHSPKDAHGIWQFIPGTGDRYGLQRTAWSDERGSPEKSTRAAARYLRDLHALFGDWLLSLAAYNWGEGHVARVIHRTGIRDFWILVDRGLLPLETANYVPSVLAASSLLLDNSKPAAGGKTLTRISKDSRLEIHMEAVERKYARLQERRTSNVSKFQTAPLDSSIGPCDDGNSAGAAR